MHEGRGKKGALKHRMKKKISRGRSTGNHARARAPLLPRLSLNKKPDLAVFFVVGIYFRPFCAFSWHLAVTRVCTPTTTKMSFFHDEMEFFLGLPPPTPLPP